MKRIVAVLLGIGIVSMVLAFLPADKVEGQDKREVTEKFIKAENKIPNRYIVVLEDWAAGALGPESNADAVAWELGIVYQGRIDRVFKNAINGFSVEMNEKQAEMLSRDSRVLYVEEDGIMSIDQTQTQNNATWGLDRIDQRDLPLNGTYTYNANGSGVRAYIIDTGIRATHNDLGGRVSGGFTAINDGRGTNDCNGHGTHVAGTVGGTTWGVAKNVSLVPVRVLNCQGSGTTSGVIAGVDWVTANHVKPAVANMSLGGGASSTLDAAVNNSIVAGVTYAVAAGNSNANACNYSPARVAAAITVGSTTSTDARSSFSNFGSCVNIFAPGSSITSAWHTNNSSTNTISGTSMASPHVAGVAALYLQGNTGASPATVANAIINNATPNKVTSPGNGSPNLLLYSLFGSAPTPTPTPTGTPTPTPTPSGIALAASAFKQQGINYVNLIWSGASGSNVVVFKGNSNVADPPNTGSFTYNTGQRGGGSDTYRVCETNLSVCSPNVTVSY